MTSTISFQHADRTWTATYRATAGHNEVIGLTDDFGTPEPADLTLALLDAFEVAIEDEWQYDGLMAEWDAYDMGLDNPADFYGVYP